MPILSREYTSFPFGTFDNVDDQTIPDGAAAASMNWFTMGDRIQLRNGYRQLGAVISGVGKIRGLHVAYKSDGTQLLFRKRDRKIEYFDEPTQLWVEVGTDILPATATNDDVSFD